MRGAVRFPFIRTSRPMLGRKWPSETGDLLLQVELVAGARNALNLEFSWTSA